MPDMPWPQFAPEGEASAATYLEAIIAHCEARLLLLPPNPNNQFVQKWTAIHDAAAKDLANIDHGRLRLRVTAAGDDAVPNGRTTAWNDVRNAYTTVTAPAPQIAELTSALESIDHMGGGGAPSRKRKARRRTLPGWLGFRPTADDPTLAELLNGVVATAWGAVLRAGASADAVSTCASVLSLAWALRRSASESSSRVKSANQRAAYSALRAANEALRPIEVSRDVVFSRVEKLRTATKRAAAT